MKNIKIRILILVSLVSQVCRAQDTSVQFHYLGHSSFLIRLDNGLSILTDYGKPNAWVEYGWDSPIYDIGDFRPAICTYSHEHDDHYDPGRIAEKDCRVLDKADTLVLEDLTIYPVLSSEDDLSLKSNRSYLFDYKGLQILHLGDCQANIMYVDSAENIDYIQKHFPVGCDIVLMPIEGKCKFIPQTKKFIQLIHPRILIPMHYWSEAYKQEFLEFMLTEEPGQKMKYKVRVIDDAKYTITPDSGADGITEILSLSPAEYGNP